MPTPATTSGPLPLLPAAAFVVVWSSGYIAGPYGVDHVAPLTLVALRFIVAAAAAVAIARALRGPLRIGRADLAKLSVTGILLNAVVFGAMYLAFERGLSATLASLLHSLSPVLTALLAAVFLRDRLAPIQVAGFVVGVAGVGLVLGPEIGAAGGIVAVGLGVLSMIGLSTGTLGQRWTGGAVDPIWGAAIQFAAAVPPAALLAVVLERDTELVGDVWQASVAVGYLALVNSVVGLLLLGILVRARGPGVAGSVFFLMPPVTAVLAWTLLGESLNARELVGLAITVIGVAAATRGPGATPSRRLAEYDS